VAELLSAFSADPSMLAFAQHFCAALQSYPEARAFSTFCSTILHECVASEKPAIVRTYLELYTSVHRVAETVAKGGGVNGLDCLTVANLKVC
jgi:anaphase-promoting complex subunit 1